jgi:multisubunit Na+/H+ antiporter MnhC subunit
MTTATIYAAAGIVLVGIGLYRLVTTGDLLRRVVALNVASGGAGAVLVAAAYRAAARGRPTRCRTRSSSPGSWWW